MSSESRFTELASGFPSKDFSTSWATTGGGLWVSSRSELKENVELVSLQIYKQDILFILAGLLGNSL